MGQAEIKEIQFVRLGDDEYYLLTQASDSAGWGYAQTLVSASSGKVSELIDRSYVLSMLVQSFEDCSVVAQDLLHSYDNYYYSRASADSPSAPLPVLRVKFDDPSQSWFYVDLKTSQLVYQSHRLGRLKRGLYSGLHGLDFRFWYSSRPLWDVGVIFLLWGGLTVCSIGCYLGFK